MAACSLGAGRARRCLALLAWLLARTTIYTITDQRVVMRFGVALPMTFNLPFAASWSPPACAGTPTARRHSAACSVPASASPTCHLWPHVRPWHYSRIRSRCCAACPTREVAALLSPDAALGATGDVRAACRPLRVRRGAAKSSVPPRPATAASRPDGHERTMSDPFDDRRSPTRRRCCRRRCCWSRSRWPARCPGGWRAVPRVAPAAAAVENAAAALRRPHRRQHRRARRPQTAQVVDRGRTGHQRLPARRRARPGARTAAPAASAPNRRSS